VVFWESHQRIPKGDHTLEPNMLEGPHADLGKKHVGADRRPNPKDQP
jgi:hypothetical protein